MEVDAAAPAPGEEQQQPQQQAEAAPASEAEQATSLGYLQLQDAFKRMVAVGVDVVDQEAFYRVMAGVPEHLLWPMWQIYMRVVANIVDNSMAEFEELASEVALQQQLADIEALALQRGRALGADADDSPSEDPAAGPAAAAAAARVAAKRAERAALQDMLAKYQRQREDLQGQVDARSKAVEGLKVGYKRVADQMGEVHAAMHNWQADAAMRSA